MLLAGDSQHPPTCFRYLTPEPPDRSDPTKDPIGVSLAGLHHDGSCDLGLLSWS
jgi:hypothetical protein